MYEREIELIEARLISAGLGVDSGEAWQTLKTAVLAQPTNSDYTAALRVWREEWLPLVDKGNHIGNFAWYCEQRLNSAKAPNCA